MGIINSKEYCRKKIDEATSNSSLSNLRYITTERSKWKVFGKKEIIPTPMYTPSYKPVKGCPCGNNGPCKQKVTPKGVTIHYPQKKKKFGVFVAKTRRLTPLKLQSYYNANARILPKVKVVRPRKFPTWRLDKISHNRPFYSSSPVIIRPRPYQPAA